MNDYFISILENLGYGITSYTDRLAFTANLKKKSLICIISELTAVVAKDDTLLNQFKYINAIKAARSHNYDSNIVIYFPDIPLKKRAK